MVRQLRAWERDGGDPDEFWRRELRDKEVAGLFLAATVAGMFCPFLPPWRSKVLRTIKAPEFAESPCNWQACKFKGCKGNVSYYDAEGRLSYR